MGLTMQSHILVVCQLLAVTQSAPQVAVDSVVAAAQPPPTAVDPSAVPAVAPSAVVTPAVIPSAAVNPTAATEVAVGPTAAPAVVPPAASDPTAAQAAAEASPPAQNAATENVNELPSVANASSIAIASS